MSRRGHWHMMIEEEEYERQISDRVLVKRLLNYVGKFKRRVMLLITVVLFSTLLNLLPPFLFTLAVDQYISALDFPGLTLLCLGFIVIYISTFFTEYARTYLIYWFGGKLEYEIRMDMFRKLQLLSLSYYANRQVGGVVSKVTNDVEKITELITSGVASAIADIATLIGIVSIMLWLNTWLSLISFTVIPMIVVFMFFWGRRVRKVYRETRKTIASISAKIEEGVSGMKEIQSFSREKSNLDEFQKANISNMAANIQAGRVMSAFWPAVSIFGTLGNSLVLLFGGSAVMNGTLTIGILFGFMSYINRFFMPIQDLSMFWNNVQSAMAAAERIFRLLDTKVDIQEKEEAFILPIIKGEIKYENVTFGYDPLQPVLRNISFVIQPNMTVALVGPTGAGKTSMINLLYRFYDPQSGRITIDDYNLIDVELESLRNQMAIVLQDTFLFSGTIKDNIRYGKLEATDEEIIAIAKAVGAHEFIIDLPDKYDTEVRERGSRLSIGQRQLISFARALLANPRILIMDEATSSIDAYTELIIKKALEKVLRNRTSIVIAHRLSTVQNADCIVVINKGKIVEIGKSRELLEKGGLYKKLYDSQFKYAPKK